MPHHLEAVVSVYPFGFFAEVLVLLAECTCRPLFGTHHVSVKSNHRRKSFGFAHFRHEEICGHPEPLHRLDFEAFAIVVREFLTASESDWRHCFEWRINSQ